MKSEIDGLVFNVIRHKGEIVNPQSALAIIGNAQKYVIELKVDEYDITKINIGQEVVVRLDSYQDQVFAANQITGGERQRVAIARALINDPLIIMGDEPTGNLDKKNSETVFDIFEKLSQHQKQSLLIVTHDEEFAKRTDSTILMEDGKIINSWYFKNVNCRYSITFYFLQAIIKVGEYQVNIFCLLNGWKLYSIATDSILWGF